MDLKTKIIKGMTVQEDVLSQKIRIENLEGLVKELSEGLDRLYLSGLTEKQIAFVERLQDKIESLVTW